MRPFLENWKHLAEQRETQPKEVQEARKPKPKEKAPEKKKKKIDT